MQQSLDNSNKQQKLVQILSAITLLLDLSFLIMTKYFPLQMLGFIILPLLTFLFTLMSYENRQRIIDRKITLFVFMLLWVVYIIGVFIRWIQIIDLFSSAPFEMLILTALLLLQGLTGLCFLGYARNLRLEAALNAEVPLIGEH